MLQCNRRYSNGCPPAPQYGSVKARDVINRRLYKGLIISDLVLCDRLLAQVRHSRQLMLHNRGQLAIIS
ncbi:hypothetical protein GNF10_10120 [Nostoc sp. UCD121]|uniref:hypothetical protein n=1 Tax=unclassified Nostoc TaxID=2593658 RepID=UPI001623C9A5|nr:MULTISPECIES: hypothetical protein [unclassified Nostoc]MBC1222536.1 hypothetical protein [Nostoc sp. UCD120]MBC1276336.1 hypothetical protein [Nostoc sp. UCD121]